MTIIMIMIIMIGLMIMIINMSKILTLLRQLCGTQSQNARRRHRSNSRAAAPQRCSARSSFVIIITIIIVIIIIIITQCSNWCCTWMTSLTRALSVPILAFFITDTLGPIQVQNTNFERFDNSSPVWNWSIITRLELYHGRQRIVYIDDFFFSMEIMVMLKIMMPMFTMIFMYPKPRSSAVKWALKSAKSFPLALTPILLSV